MEPFEDAFAKFAIGEVIKLAISGNRFSSSNLGWAIAGLVVVMYVYYRYREWRRKQKEEELLKKEEEQKKLLELVGKIVTASIKKEVHNLKRPTNPTKPKRR